VQRGSTPARSSQHPDHVIEDVESAIDDLGYRLRPEDRGRMTIAAAVMVRDELLRMGYDALVIRDAGGDGVDVVVALRREIVKVVID
jgi:hypothetical protein